MKQSKKTLPLLLALSAMGLSACNFAGGGSSSAYSGGGGGGEKTISSSEKIEEGFVVDEKTWNQWMKGNAIYLKEGRINISSGPLYESFDFVGKNVCFTSNNRYASYLSYSKVPTSPSEVVTASRYEYVERANYHGYEKTEEEISLQSFIEEVELPQIDFALNDFTKVASEKGYYHVRYEAQNISIRVGDANYLASAAVEFHRSSGSFEMTGIYLKYDGAEYDFRFDPRFTDPVNMPSDYRVYEEFSYELNEDEESYTIVGTMSEDHFLEVPATYLGKPVTAIGPEFFNTTDAIVVIFPASVTSIKGENPSFNSHILEVVAPSLDPSLFDYYATVCVSSMAKCHYRITDSGFIVRDDRKEVHGYVGKGDTVTYPEGYTTLPDLGCRGMENVTELIIPEGYTHIGCSPFYYMRTSKDIKVSLPNSLSTYTSGNSFNYPYRIKTNEKNGLRYLGNAQNPYVMCIDDDNTDYFKENTVFKVEDGCRVVVPYIYISDPKFTEIEIPDSVVWFNSDCLSHILTSTVTKIYIGGCTSFSWYSASYVSGVTEFTFGPNATGTANLSQFKALESLTINGPIQVYAQDLNYLTSIHLGEYCTNVPSEAFKGDRHVDELVIDNPAVNIGANALTDLAVSAKEIGDGYYFAVGDNEKAILYSVNEDYVGFFTVGAGVKSIAANAFYGADHITKVVLPEGLITIGNRAFYDLSNINAITLPNSLLTIGDRAFYGTSITEAILPEGLKTIGEYAFYDTHIESVTIPAGIEKVGEDAFFYCRSLTSVTINCGSEPFGREVFQSCYELTSVIFNKPFKNVPQGMFRYSNKLELTAFPEGLETIGNESFCGATLKVNALPEGLKSIGEYNFTQEMEGKIRLPSTLVEIAPNAFLHASFIVSEDNPVYASDSAGSLLSKDKKSLILLSGEIDGAYTLPDGIVRLEEHAIDNTELVKLVANSELKTLSRDCIENNFRLRALDLSAATIEVLPYDGIRGNQILTDFHFPQGLKRLESYALNNNALRSLELPETVTYLGRYCLSSNPLYRVVLPDGLEEADIPFTGMGNLEIIYSGSVDLKLEDNYNNGSYIVTSKSESHFSISDDGFVTYRDDDDKVHLIDYVGSETTVTIPARVQILDRSVFARADQLTKINIPLTVTHAHREFMNMFYGQVEVHYAGDWYQWRTLFDSNYVPDSYTYQDTIVNYTQEEHVHTWSEWEVTEEPVCGDHDGEKTRSCDVCGETETETIEKHAEHSYGEWEIVTPCSAELASKDPDFDGDPSKDNGYGKFGGSRKKTCEYCGDVVETRVGSAYATSRQNMLSGTKKARSSETLPDPQYNRVKTYYRQSATSQEGSPTTIDNPLNNSDVKPVVFYDADWETFWDKSNMYGGEGYSYLDSDCLVGGYWNLDQPSGSRDTFFYEARFEVDNGNGRICLIVDTWGYIWKIVCYKTIIGSYPETMSWSLRMEWSKVEA